MSRILKVAIVLAILALIVNDGGRWAQGTIDLHTSTGQVLDQAALTARRFTQTQIAGQLGQLAAAQKIRVTQFATTPSGIHIWAEEDVSGTWLLGPYLAVNAGVPLAKSWSTPIILKYDSEEAIR